MSDTDWIDDLLDEFYWGTVSRPVKGIDEGNTDELDVIMTHKRNISGEAKAAIEQKLTDARIDELKLCLGDKNVMPLDFSDIKDRIAALQASKEGK